MVVVAPEVVRASIGDSIHEPVRSRVVENRGERGVRVPEPSLDLQRRFSNPSSYLR